MPEGLRQETHRAGQTGLLKPFIFQQRWALLKGGRPLCFLSSLLALGEALMILSWLTLHQIFWGGKGKVASKSNAHCSYVFISPDLRIHKETQFTYFGLPVLQYQRHSSTLFFNLQLFCKFWICRKPCVTEEASTRATGVTSFSLEVGKKSPKRSNDVFCEIQSTFTSREIAEMPGHSLLS